MTIESTVNCYLQWFITVTQKSKSQFEVIYILSCKTLNWVPDNKVFQYLNKKLTLDKLSSDF